jgi:hypothetical protein
MVATYPTRSEADAWRSYWAQRLRKLPAGASYGITVRPLPGSDYWAIVVEPLADDAELTALLSPDGWPQTYPA